MDLSISSAAAYNTATSALGRRTRLGDSEQPAQLTPASESGNDDTGTAESSTHRPVRESRESNRLNAEEQLQVKELQLRDREVKAHELAHKAVGGRYVTGSSFSYQTGPDGRRYAIGGEVSIDTSAAQTPQETLYKAEQIRRAALAPADPSPQDYHVASQATQMAAQARAEIFSQRYEEAMQAQEARQEQNLEEEAGNEQIIPRQELRAIAFFKTISRISTLASNPDPIDEMI
jgi:hypothetical protein